MWRSGWSQPCRVSRAEALYGEQACVLEGQEGVGGGILRRKVWG